MTKQISGMKNPMNTEMLRRVFGVLVVLLVASAVLVGAGSADISQPTAAANPNNVDGKSIIFGELTCDETINSVTIELYSDNTKLATTIYRGNHQLSTLSWYILLKGTPSSSWDTVWESGHPRADVVPSHIITTVNNQYNCQTAVTFNYDSGTIITSWSEMPGLRVAKIGETYYDSLQGAIDAANDGETITLIGDITLTNTCADHFEVKDKTVTIDLNGNNVTASGCDGVFQVVNGGHLTLTGDGTVTALECQCGYAMAVWSTNSGSKVTINGGTYKQTISNTNDDHFDLIYASDSGSITITGGKFESETPKWTLNLKDNDGASFEVKGGEFVGYDPSNSDTEPADQPSSFLASGYTATSNGNGNFGVTETSPEPTPQKPSSSSSSSGSSVWLTETQTQTPTPTPTETATPTDSVPTDIPVTQPTSEPASPGFGILAALAGLGAVAVLRRK